jgi:hypothetical protein
MRNVSTRHRRSIQRRNARATRDEIITAVFGIALIIMLIGVLG